jgi:hypothetical protein
MDQALDSDFAWDALHGKHAVPKKYVPPFLAAGKDDTKQGGAEGSDEIDRLYELEIERKFMGKDAKKSKPRLDTSDDEDQAKRAEEVPAQATGHVSEMKFIKVKINSLRVENEELLHQLID